MINAWSLAYEELYGDMDKEYPIMTNRTGEDITILGGGGDDTIEIKSSEDRVSVEFPTGNFYAADTVSFSSISSDTLDFGYPLSGGMGQDRISFNTSHLVDDVYAYHFPSWENTEKPKPDLKGSSNQKYQEDKGIRDLKDYVSSTYQGHYTNDNSDVQTLDLIHSVGDAESFCRSNALKYLSRYDKKGQAKRDILKAMHYCLLLYYFSGHTNETPTRGYETF